MYALTLTSLWAHINRKQRTVYVKCLQVITKSYWLNKSCTYMYMYHWQKHQYWFFNQADIHILKTSNKYFAWIGKNGQKANQKLYKNSQKY